MGDLIRFDYRFEFPDGRSRAYQLALHPETLEIQKSTTPQSLPVWTALTVGQCSHCPLKVETHPECPIAVNLKDLFEAFRDEKSFSEVTMHIQTAERTFSKTLPLQNGLFSIFGLIMATSGCPIMCFLKPMARFHLPFATFEETTVRTVSIYLMAQYFKLKRGETPDWELKDLDRHYAELQKVNQGMIQRLRSMATTGDANQNSVTILDTFAKLLGLSLKKDLQKFEYLFVNP